LEEARRACRLSGTGAAHYELGELHRLRGEFPEAEEAYREASRRGRVPQPGLVRLRLAQGRTDDAVAAIQRLVEEAAAPRRQRMILPAYVDVMLEAGETQAAREGAESLSEMAEELAAPLLVAQAAAARGAVLLEEGDTRAALTELQIARTTWEKLEAPYEAARAKLLIARACRELGDHDTADVEHDGAVRILERLGATGDLSFRSPARQEQHGLTPRELEVLRLVASGATNREIGDALFISERTVERHVSHIFRKLHVSSRAGATAYAYEHGLV
jgi:DNA-binding CsgD family transcriptional regulator